MRILVVDDDTLSRELLTLLLEVEGHEVETAVSGEAAVARLTRGGRDGPWDPAVVLTDVQMPGLAGDALGAALRPMLAPGTLLLAMSGSDPGPSTLGRFDGFLLKPFKVSELQAIVDAATMEAAGPGHAEARGAEAGEVAGGDGSDAGALDEEIFAKMREVMPAAQLGQMYALCVEDARRRIARMEALSAAGDDVEYRKEAHAVKGGSGMIGAAELYRLSSAAEQEGLPQRGSIPGTSGVTVALAQLSLACDRLERILGERTRE